MDTDIAAARAVARDCESRQTGLVQIDEYSELVAAECFQLEAIRASRALLSLPGKAWVAVGGTSCEPSAGHGESRNPIAPRDP